MNIRNPAVVLVPLVELSENRFLAGEEVVVWSWDLLLLWMLT